MGYTLPMSLIKRLARHLLDLDATEAWMEAYALRVSGESE